MGVIKRLSDCFRTSTDTGPVLRSRARTRGRAQRMLRLFDPEVGDCAARRGTSDLVDTLGHFRDALQCCREKNPRALSTMDSCVDRHIRHRNGSEALRAWQARSKLPFF